MKYIYRLMFLITAIIFVIVFTQVFCNLLSKEPKFSDLYLNSGVLKRIGDLDGSKSGRHLPVWVEVNGAEIKFRLPPIISKDQLASNVDKEINIYIHKIWLSNDEVWHVSGNNTTYYEYKDRLERTKTIKPFFTVIEFFLILMLMLYTYFKRTKIKNAWNGNSMDELVNPDDN